MKARTLLLLCALGLVIVSTGCYTKLYRQGMEDMGPYSSNSLYNRYDSTAIDTTLTKPEIVDVYPNNGYYDNNGWSYWGRPRGYTRWGFDFDRFSPNYYWSYYGYYDYYSRPWWQDWNRNPWWGPSVPGAPGEPPSQRPGRRSNDATPPPANLGGYSGGGAIYAPNPAPTTPGNPPPPEVKQPIGPAVKNPPAPTPPVEDNTQKRNGRRRK